ncbi:MULTISPECIES: hypothetical protein [unclassified Sinorhizobium]|uniref:hypothetical protein n=1 Tax=unclassified Sinorhizobium TaxID=2613772 RepID=UPI003523785E
MTQITSTMLADMHARRLSGEGFADIARSYGLKQMTVYQAMRRKYGLDAYRLTSANDNHPDRATRMSAHNGGCSTLSGLMPVTVPMVADTPAEDDADMAAGIAVNEYMLQQVAA